MSLVAESVSVSGPSGPLVLPTSLTAPAGSVTHVAADPGEAASCLALVLTGRMRPGPRGSVTWEGSGDHRRLRRELAIVDAVAVNAPDASVSVRGVLGEELALSGLRSDRRAIDRFLTSQGQPTEQPSRWDAAEPGLRTSWLIDITSQRRAVRGLVVVSPDRWGGDPRPWSAAAHRAAEAGLVVVVLCTHVTLAALDHAPDAEMGIA